MPHIPTAYGNVTFTVLIPTRGRPEALARSLKKMPWLNDMDTIIGLHGEDRAIYADVQAANRFTRWVTVHNPTGSVAVARELLRTYAMGNARADYYVVTDDNAVHASEAALHNLVRCAHEYRMARPTVTVGWGEVAHAPVIMAGMHNTAMHFDRGKLKHTKTLYGLRSYPSVAMIFQVYPHDVYSRYAYPANAYGLDDRHFFLWCISIGITDFRVCMDAPFTKSRYQEGGQGDIRSRMLKTGQAIEQLAHDFPILVGATGTLRIPWQFLLAMGTTGTADRLVGGSMRKEEQIVQSTGTPVRVRRRRSSV